MTFGINNSSRNGSSWFFWTLVQLLSTRFPKPRSSSAGLHACDHERLSKALVAWAQSRWSGWGLFDSKFIPRLRSLLDFWIHRLEMVEWISCLMIPEHTQSWFAQEKCAILCPAQCCTHSPSHFDRVLASLSRRHWFQNWLKESGNSYDHGNTIILILIRLISRAIFHPKII